MLELTQSEQSVLQLLLSDHDGLVEVGPPPVDLGQGLLDSSGLVRGSFVREIVSLSKEKTISNKYNLGGLKHTKLFSENKMAISNISSDWWTVDTKLLSIKCYESDLWINLPS